MSHRHDRPVLICQHSEASPPGTALEALADLGVGADVRRLHAGAGLPDAEHLADYRGLIVLGGAMNTDDDAEYPFLVAERELLVEAVTSDVPVFGICLGAQQLARALGGRVYERETPEAGWLPVRLTVVDPLFAGMTSSFEALEWHAQSFTLPLDATVLALGIDGDDGVQAFRAGRRAWGVQFHPEIDEPMLDGWLERDNKGLERRDPEMLRRLHRHGQEIVRRSRELCRTLIGNFVDSFDPQSKSFDPQSKSFDPQSNLFGSKPKSF